MTRSPNLLQGFNVTIHEDFLSDLEAIEEEPGGYEIADDIYAYLLELADTPRELRNLMTDGAVFSTGGAVQFDVALLTRLQLQFPGTFRLKLLGDDRALHKYRIIYVYTTASQTFHVLGLMNREIDYEFDHPLFERIFRRYGEL